MKTLPKLGLLGCTVTAFFAACSSSPSNVTGGSNGTAGSSTASSNGTAGGGSGLGGSLFSGSSATLMSGAGPGAGTGSGGGDPQCGGDTSKAEVIPLDIYLMLDSSGSMLDQTGANAMGPTKWSSITQALGTFFADPSSAGLGVGLQHFPLLGAGVPAACSANSQCPGQSGPCLLKICDGLQAIVPCTKDSDCFAQGSPTCAPLGQCGNEFCFPADGSTCTDNNQACDPIVSSFCINEDSCVAGDYAKPAVEVTQLNGAAASLGSAIAKVMPQGATPTAPALQGAIDHAKAWATAHPTHEVVVLLATDGLPTECSPQDVPSIAALAAAGVSGTPSIKTFAIGVFATADLQNGAQTNLDQIAKGGGSQKAFIIDTSKSDVEQSFLAALNAIRGTKLACEYLVPKAGDAGELDYAKVNVEYTPSGMTTPATVGYVGSKAACDPVSGGWYYDVDPAQSTPTKIITCPATCTKFGMDTGGQVDIRVGCKTLVQPPPQ